MDAGSGGGLILRARWRMSANESLSLAMVHAYNTVLPRERKSVEPMAAQLYPNRVRQAHQCMHHIVADAARK